MQWKFSQPTLLHNIKGTYHREPVWGSSTSFFLGIYLWQWCKVDAKHWAFLFPSRFDASTLFWRRLKHSDLLTLRWWYCAYTKAMLVPTLPTCLLTFYLCTYAFWFWFYSIALSSSRKYLCVVFFKCKYTYLGTVSILNWWKSSKRQ